MLYGFGWCVKGLLLDLLSKLSGRGMLTLACPMALISSRLDSPLMAPLVLRQRSSHRLVSSLKAHSRIFSRVSFTIVKGVAEWFIRCQLTTFMW